MKLFQKIGLIAIASIAIVGCGGGGTPDFSIYNDEDIVGTWEQRLTEPEGEEGCLIITVKFNSDGTAKSNLKRYDDNNCSINEDLQEDNFTYTLGEIRRDFDGNEARELNTINDDDTHQYSMYKFDNNKLRISKKEVGGRDGSTEAKRANKFDPKFLIFNKK